MERHEQASLWWAIAGFLALSPAIFVTVYFGILFLGSLPALPHALIAREATTLRAIAWFGGITVGGCVGLAAVWLSVAFPRELQGHSQAKRAVLFIMCVGSLLLLYGVSFVGRGGWQNGNPFFWWLVLGPSIMGVCGSYRLICSKQP
jgi:hypothetical protein